MKKILSITLALIMLLSVMPLGFSVSAKGIPDYSLEAVELKFKVDAYLNNIYVLDNPDARDYIEQNIWYPAFTEFDYKCPAGKFRPKKIHDNEWLNDSENKEQILAATEFYKTVLEEIETYIAEVNASVVLDMYELYHCLNIATILYSEEELDSLGDVEPYLETSEKYADMYHETMAAFDKMYDIQNGYIEQISQAEIDAITKNAVSFYELAFNCVDGNHIYTVADGSKTSVCEFCGFSPRDYLIQEFVKGVAYRESYYADGERAPVRLDHDYFVELLITNDEEKMLDYAAELKEYNYRTEERIANGQLIVVIDVYNFAEAFVKFIEAYCCDLSRAEIFDRIPERNPEWSEKCDAAYNKIGDLPSNGGTQVEYDVYEEIVIDAIELCLKHMYGEHDFAEYISDNNATEEADGTKTATCEFCGATDTVTDEGSKIVNNKDDNNSNCSCNCHKKGFSAFIWKILCFFYKVFGMNRTCACGVAHY